MKRIMCVFGLAIAALVVPPGCSTLPQSDSAALQGTWKGQEAGDNSGGVCTLVISGDALEFRGADPNEWYKGTFILREGTHPKQLIGVIRECPAPEYVGKTVNALYQINAETLILTGNEPGEPEMPAGFDSPGSRKFILRRL